MNRLLAAGPSVDSSNTLDSSPTTEYWIARGKALNASSFIGQVLGQDGQSMAAEAVIIFKPLRDMCPNDLVYSYYLSKEKDPLECLELFRKTGHPFFIGEMLLILTNTSVEMENSQNPELTWKKGYGWIGKQAIGTAKAASCGNWACWNFWKATWCKLEPILRPARPVTLESGNEEMYTFTQRFFAWMALAQGDMQQAVQYSRAQLAAGTHYFIPWVMIDALGFLGWEAFTAGDMDLAVTYCKKSLNLMERPDYTFLAVAQYVMANIAMAQGDFNSASAFLKAFVTKNSLSWPPVQLGIQVTGSWR